MYRPSSSLWRLWAMIQGLLAVVLLLMWVFSSWALTQVFDEFGRSVVEDDLGEYRSVYEREGVEGVRALFAAGRHESDQIVRIVDANGAVLLEDFVLDREDLGGFDGADLPRPTNGETIWTRRRMAGGATVTIGGRRLTGGGEIWFGRSNLADLEAIGRIHRWIALAVGVTAVLSIGPSFWFARQVLRPVRVLVTEARRLVHSGPTLQRLESSVAIPEIRELATAFNHGLNQVQAATEELEAANDQLAHELRTPLARIRGNVETILTLSESATVREGAARAIGEIERATRLIQAILMIRAGEARTLTLNRSALALEELVSESVELYAPAAEEVGINLCDLAPHEGEGIVVRGDRERLQQAFCSLLDNALAYTHRGGRVEVGTRVEGEFGVVFVADNGPGLSDADHERIWRRFMRGSAASASVPGIGLGLSVVRSIARAHGGEAGARNRPGGGVEFWFRVARSVPSESGASRATDEGSSDREV